MWRSSTAFGTCHRHPLACTRGCLDLSSDSLPFVSVSVRSMMHCVALLVSPSFNVYFGGRCLLYEQCQDSCFRVGRSHGSAELKIAGQVGDRCAAVNFKLDLTSRIQDRHPMHPSSLPPFNLCPRGSPTWTSSIFFPVPLLTVPLDRSRCTRSLDEIFVVPLCAQSR